MAMPPPSLSACPEVVGISKGKCSSALSMLWQGRWLVMIASLWLQTCAGIGYAFGGYSPLVKSTLGYTQQQITILGIAKDLGGNVGLMAGALSGILPVWCLIIIGTVQNLGGYGWLWLIVTGKAPALPLWAVCLLILIGTNGETYWNTVTLVTNVSNFPKSRGHVSGLLKGFNGLCSAIFAQVYITFFAPDQAAYLLIISVGPTVVSLLTMSVIRKIETTEGGKQPDAIGFSFIYADSVVIAAYLMGSLILQDLMTVSFKGRLMILILLLVMVALPSATPMLLWVVEARRQSREDAERGHQIRGADKGLEAPLLKGYEEGTGDLLRHDERRVETGFRSHEEHGDMASTRKDEGVYEKACTGKHVDEGQGELDYTSKDSHENGQGEAVFMSGDLGRAQFRLGSRAGSFVGSVAMSELEDEKPEGLDLLPEVERKRKLLEVRGRIIIAAAEGAVRVKKGKGPRRGEDFTLAQALVKADFWLLFLVVICGAGTGMAAIDNMGQISQSQGYANSSVFVSMTSIFNFLGRLLGGYFSEILVRTYALPRSWAIAMAQGVLGVGLSIIAMGWPRTLYVGTLLVGIGYGSHWGIVPPLISEIFGIKNFGMFYNFYTMGTPVGVLFFSGFLVGYLYDIEAAKQQQTTYVPGMLTSVSTSCSGAVCFRSSFLVMVGVCIIGIFLATILSLRTRSVYTNLYNSKSALVRGS